MASRMKWAANRCQPTAPPTRTIIKASTTASRSFSLVELFTATPDSPVLFPPVWALRWGGAASPTRAGPHLRVGEPGSCQKGTTLTESQTVSPLPWPYGRVCSSHGSTTIRYGEWMYARSPDARPQSQHSRDDSTGQAGADPSGKVVLSVAGLRKSYSRVVAVDGVSFDVHRREVVGLLGPNGAGKTTTINMILGVLSPTAGSVYIGGVDLARERARALAHANFSAVYAPLPGNLTVTENLRFFGLVYGIAQLRRRVGELLRQFDLERLRDTKCGLLSSGEQTRVALA